MPHIRRTVARDCELLSPAGVAYRGLFLIEREGIVRQQVVNDLPLGRSVEEATRMVARSSISRSTGRSARPTGRATGDATKAAGDSTADYLSNH